MPVMILLSLSSLSVFVLGEPAAPKTPVRLVFIHHSVGENWLSDDDGGLGLALKDSNYYVSDTNYDWGPDGIGSSTDIGNWWQWFRGPHSTKYLSALYTQDQQSSDYSRMSTNPGGENQIVMFKSCFPNSALQGNADDVVLSIENNPLRGEGSGSEFHTVANAKGIYIDLLEYFKTRPDKLFVVITAPPQVDATYANNARAFNNWLVESWLKNYSVGNVFVFDFYNVLTTNGGSPDTNDVGQLTGNHHRWLNGQIQHKTDGDNDASPNNSEYPTGDDHPSAAGNQKATVEFVPLLNYFVSTRTMASPTSPASSSTAPTQTDTSEVTYPSLTSEAPETNIQENTNENFPFEYAVLAVGAAIVIVILAGVFLRRNGSGKAHPPPPPE
jgi:hypothetical protein